MVALFINKLMHVMKQSLKKIFGENTLRNSLFCAFITSIMFDFGFDTQKKLLPRPHLNTDFRFHDFYMVRINPQTILAGLKSDWWDEGVDNLHRFVLDGDWDLGSIHLNDTSDNNPRKSTALTIKQLFIDKIDYQECEQYKEMKIQIDKGNNYAWCNTLEDIDAYFNLLYCLYEDLKNKKYKIQSELKSSDLSRVGTNRYNQVDEIRISIGRRGDMILGLGGTHRILIASLVDLEEVTVIIEAVHIDWAKECYAKHKTDIISAVKRELDVQFRNSCTR